MLLIGFFSCSSDSELANQANDLNYKVTFTINSGKHSTRGVDSQKKGFTTAALEREKTISSLYAIAFNKSDDTFYKIIKVSLPSASDVYEFDLRRVGAFKLLLVANASEELVKKLNEFTPTSTLSDLASVIVTQNPGEDAQATNFLMTSDLKTDVSTVAGGPTQLGVIELIRLVARFDFYNQVKGLKMTKITFNKRAVGSYLIDPVVHDGLIFTNNKNYTIANGLSALTSIGAIYSYEYNAATDCVFTLEGTYNGKAVTAKSIRFKDLFIQRNHLYNVIITADESSVIPSPDDPTDFNGKLNFEVQVANWNEAEIIHFTDDQLVNEEAPTFAANGAGVVTTPADDIIPAVVTASNEATVVTIMATSASSADSKLNYSGELPSGWHLMDQVAGDISHTDDQLTHKYTIQMTENATFDSRSLVFELTNVFNSDAKVLFTLTQTGAPIPLPDNPLNYVAEFNLQTAKTFATKNSNYSGDNAMFDFDKANSGNIAPDGYHVPSIEELKTIAPIQSPFRDVSNAVEGRINIHGDIFSDAMYDSKKIRKNLSYALRFKDSEGKVCARTCAFLYRWEETEKGMTVICRPLGASFSGDINTISEESFWTSNKENDVTRFFAACGYKKNSRSLVTSIGGNTHYWSSMERSSSVGWNMYVSNSSAIFQMGNDKPFCYPIRVFRD